MVEPTKFETAKNGNNMEEINNAILALWVASVKQPRIVQEAIARLAHDISGIVDDSFPPINIRLNSGESDKK